MLSSDIFDKFKVTLTSGHYHLLLGSGVSSDSLQSDSKTPLVSAWELTKALNLMKGLPEHTPLSRVSLLLTEEEINNYLTQPYSGCKAGITARCMPKFIWKSIYTFNIDDCVEHAYERDTSRAQSLDTIVYTEPFRIADNRSVVPIVHLHGFSRRPEEQYVFSTTQYGQNARSANPWMMVLSELIASEAFIISGTSLNEPDLEYYLASRNRNTPRINRGPSLLIEPNPDALTVSLCERHSLILVKATLGEFFSWVMEKIDSVPTLLDLQVPDINELFHPAPNNISQISFFSGFELVRPQNGSHRDGHLSPFFYGRQPSWGDLAARVDVPTKDEDFIGDAVRRSLAAKDRKSEILLLLGEPGDGKSTSLRRTAYDLAASGVVTFILKGGASFSPESVLACFSVVTKPFVVVIDAAGEHVTLVHMLATTKKIKQPYVVLACDRDYREEHIRRSLVGIDVKLFYVSRWNNEQLRLLVEGYRTRGLVGAPAAVKDPEPFISLLRQDVIAVAACRILNDFRPLDGIIKSIWNHSGSSARHSYLVVALAYHCNSFGVSYPVLRNSYSNANLTDQFEYSCPLPLTYSTDDDDYVRPLNSIVSDKVLSLVSKEKKEILLAAFSNLAMSLAPYVNRRTSIQRTPEARLAGRLFSADKVVLPLLGENFAIKFYEENKAKWEWNSRYWEQRALLTQNFDIDLAVQYGRHAVTLEAHPFPWTTLASILLRKMHLGIVGWEILYEEAYELLYKTLKREEVRDWRPTPHPYSTLFNGTLNFLKLGGILSIRRRSFIQEQIGKAEIHFPRDGSLLRVVQMLRAQFVD